MIEWEKVIDDIELKVQTKITPTKGNLVYEYNPLRNYRLTKNMYEYKDQLYSSQELTDIFGIEMDENKKDWTIKGKILANNVPILREPGELVDFITDELSFDLSHPVNILPQYSYDGSVNLIINDGINTPKLINTRFSATGRNTYEVIDRKGNNDTNIYDQGESFEIDTSLYKLVSKIPKIKFNGCSSGGNLKVGNYFFYFKLSDADGNETDFVGESGLVSVFIGFDNPSSITTGIKNENSYKNVNFTVSNIDISYNYLYVYYSRATSDVNESSNIEYKKIEKKFVVNNAGDCNILITGFEDTTDITPQDINLYYNIIDSAKSQVECNNRLFLGNVHKLNIPYETLLNLSLYFLPYLHEERYELEMDLNYKITSTGIGYYDEKFIYEKTGYWTEELYRLGIVYILPNGELTPVFNIRGGIDITDNSKFTEFTDDSEIPKIKYNENTYFIDQLKTDVNPIKYENAKGVVSFKSNNDTNIIFGIDVKVEKRIIDELKKYVKGYFFVRLKRIPTILAQGITIGIDNESRTPVIPTAQGFLNYLENSLDKTHVTTKDINDVNYISEGFLNRYSFDFKKKKSGLFKKIGMGIAIAAIAVATVYTGGAALAAIGPTIAAAGSTALAGSLGLASALAAAGSAFAGAAISATTALVGAAIATGAVAGTLAAVGTALSISYAVSRKKAGKKLNGRNTVVPNGYEIKEDENSRILSDDFLLRVIIKDKDTCKVQGILCPDYSVNPIYYNLIFTGNEHVIRLTNSQSINSQAGLESNFFNNENNHFYNINYYDANLYDSYQFKIIGVQDSVPVAGVDSLLFKGRAGLPEEPYNYLCIAENYNDDEENKKINSDIIRGYFGSYLAFNDEYNKFSPASTVNIYIPKYNVSNLLNYINIRMDDNSIYYSISDRIALCDFKETDVLGNPIGNYEHLLFRGDCYICQFTHRINRNFNAPSAPYNDKIVDKNTWKDNYIPSEVDKLGDINLGDVNAVKLGMWATFRIRSSNNLNIRTLDPSDVNESAESGCPRGYFPYFPMTAEGIYKKADSAIYNKGFTEKLNERWNFGLPDSPYIKNWFGTRIMYSDIHINDAYKNGYRVFKGSNYKDYTRSYGEIVKLETLGSNIICVFEHGVALIPINERVASGNGAGGPVYINTNNVLGEAKIISDCFGSLWADSILKVPRVNLTATGTSSRTGDLDGSYWIYGVDTVAKKIWRTDGSQINCISDLKVQEFLNNNITLGERENTPILGIRNVKTLYNAYKHDVMFTFYDNTYGFEEKAWNLCWNELLLKFITFYSWVPSFMENINNVPFSFDRNVSKWIAKLGTSHTDNSFADGITISNVILNDYFVRNNHDDETDSNRIVNDYSFTFEYDKKDGTKVSNKYNLEDIYTNPMFVPMIPTSTEACDKFIGVISLQNRMLPDSSMLYNVEFLLERDPWGNHNLFEIKEIARVKLPQEAKFYSENAHISIYGLYYKGIYGGNKKYDNAFLNPECTTLCYYSQDDFNKSDDNLVYIQVYESSPEQLMTELYYRNKAGHSYADVDSNKFIYNIQSYSLPIEETSNLLLNIIEVEKYIAEKYFSVSERDKTEIENWLYKQSTVSNYELEMSTNLPDSNIKWSHALLLKENGGVFDYKEPIYLQNNQGILFACWGGIGSMIYEPKKHAPWIEHFMRKDNVDKILNISREQIIDYPIFKDLTGKRPMLPNPLNPDKIVSLLNIKAEIKAIDIANESVLSNEYYNMKASMNTKTNLINVGLYESVIAITPKWNTQFLTSDFWRHGQAGIFDITEDIQPTNWYGKQHPFEFECIVVNDPSILKIFTNLELIANKAKPESFHYEIIGESYDFAKDKVNMYFRQEALKALWLYNGLDITYDRNFLKVIPRQNRKSADLVKVYYDRRDTINEIEDFYVHKNIEKGADYRHLSGAEIVYYPTRQEFRIWNHALAVDIADLKDTSANSFGGRGLIASNMRYLNDKWLIQINPLIVVYKNEYTSGFTNSTWAKRYLASDLIPPLSIFNSPIPEKLKTLGNISIPGLNASKLEQTNALYHLYDTSLFGKLIGVNKYNWSPLDTTKWLDDSSIYGTSFGLGLNRKETALQDRFIKIRIRYSGKELAVIDWLNTIYQISYS